MKISSEFYVTVWGFHQNKISQQMKDKQKSHRKIMTKIIKTQKKMTFTMELPSCSMFYPTWIQLK